MSKNRTKSKPPSVEDPREEGLDETSCSACGGNESSLSFARKLENERDQWEQLAIQYSAEREHNAMQSLIYKAELDEAREQRDRLAEALRECLERLEHHTEFGALVQADMSAMHSSREAIQSLTPNEL